MLSARIALPHALWALGVATAAASAGTTARSQEYCVSCTEPAAVYRCVIDKAVPTGTPLKMLCLGTLARQGGHATCAVKSGTVFDCSGPIRRIDSRSAAAMLARPPPPQATQVDPPPQPTAADRTTPAVAPPAPAAPDVGSARPAAPQRPDPQAPGEPRTVEELAKNVSRSSSETLKKAGDAIKGTTRKTWKCIASFFKSC